MGDYSERYSRAKSTMERIRLYYGVPAKRGMRVQAFELADKPFGTITGTARGAMWVRVRLDEPHMKRERVCSFHPMSLGYITEAADA